MRSPLGELPLLAPSRSILVAALVLALVLLACNTPGPVPTQTPTLAPSPTSVELTATSIPEPPDTGWLPLDSGAEMRLIQVPTGDVIERLIVVRLDTSLFRFRVLFTPGTAQIVSQWSVAYGQPLLLVNGGYFTPEYEATGLLVSDGQVYGVSYGDFAGMFAVLPGARVQVRWLADQPYDPGEMLVEAVQSFPVLVKPGGVMGFPSTADDGRPARRTVVAQDQLGRLLFIVAPRGYLTLHELARWLAESDLDLDVALNLDGGQSTGLYLSAGEPRIQVDSLVPIPSVIVVERR